MGPRSYRRAEKGEEVSFDDTIRILRMHPASGPLDPTEWKCVAARVAWVRQTSAALRDAQRQMDERCDAAVERLDEEEFERLCDLEQAKVDAIRAQLQAVIERDGWPRELYFSGI